MNVLEPIAFLWIAITGVSLWGATHNNNKFIRIIGFAIFLVFAIALSMHLLSGFNNPKIFDNVKFAEDSLPFSMYINFDKSAVGLLLLLFFIRPRQPEFKKENLFVVGKTLFALILIMLPVALLSGYVRFNPKFPDQAWIWMLNNFFLVCLAEETFFRGFIQGGLERLKLNLHRAVPILFAAVLFGLAHFKGGVAYIALATLAGLFYGYAYQQTKRIEVPMLVHFGLNLVHFLLFSYPALS